MSQSQVNSYSSMPLAQRSNWYSDVAAAYDRTRPRYPKKLIARAIDITQLQSKATILEIGCGPGIATVEFAKLGFSLVSLEPSPTACQIAQANCAAYPGVEIINTNFEDWELKEAEKFPVVLAATSWHWVDPIIGYPKVTKALQDQGFLLLLWNNIPQPSHEVYEKLQPVYSALAPALVKYEDRSIQEENLRAFGNDVINSGFFKDLISEQVVCEISYSINNYLSLLSTLSPYIALEANQRLALFAALEEVLATNFGTSIQTSYLSILQVAQKI
jgi:SAM-dependent methyltransferase